MDEFFGLLLMLRLRHRRPKNVAINFVHCKRRRQRIVYIYSIHKVGNLITPPTRRVWRSFKFAPFLVFFPVSKGRKSGYRSWVIPLCSIPIAAPMSTRLLNSISSRICRQNTQFNMYTTTSKQQEGFTFKDSHPKCFITTNFDKFHREAFARGGESR